MARYCVLVDICCIIVWMAATSSSTTPVVFVTGSTYAAVLPVRSTMTATLSGLVVTLPQDPRHAADVTAPVSPVWTPIMGANVKGTVLRSVTLMALHLVPAGGGDAVVHW